MSKKVEVKRTGDAPMTIGDMLKEKKEELARDAGGVLNPDVLIRVALNSIQRNARLMQCTPGSIYLAVKDAAAFGLFPNSITNEGHLVPFYNGKNKNWECKFMVGYKGLMKMAHNTGLITAIDVRKVYANDEFHYSFGLTPDLVHVPAKGERGEFAYCYAVVRFKEGLPSFEVLSAESAMDHGKRFSKSKDKGGDLYGPWVDDFEAMAMKTVLRMALKYAPMATLSEKMSEIIGRDERQEAAIDVDFTVPDEIREPQPIAEKAESVQEEKAVASTEDEINVEFEKAAQEGLFEEPAGAKFND